MYIVLFIKYLYISLTIKIFNCICAFSWKIKNIFAIRKCTEWNAARKPSEVSSFVRSQ